MLNDLLEIEKKHEKAAKTLFDYLYPDFRSKTIVAIGGEFGVGKAEIAYLLGNMFCKQGFNVKLLHLDNYYKVPPLQRLKWRKENGLDKIGSEEYDWDRINQTINDYKENKKSFIPIVDLFTQRIGELSTDFKDIDLLIIEGLYAVCLQQADLRVFIEQTYRDSWDRSLTSSKEKLDDFRVKVLEQEHIAVQALRNKANFFIDLKSSFFHL